ncbi:FdhF/YdeP family oxidoreductase [Hyphomicrobium sp.]|uniref:FdhF/YdeP family oxidoreductase n=1 Tax=Hyphomicrobium sp. TaxID=82 RepID=UPI0025BEE120|nr:FdhF/YdeP family oxidoreductase [Hyphomicrobium sp.]MCC7251928.1 FdhF/YdeP family oxidoreductase [Hyphomicrobium sp.]
METRPFNDDETTRSAKASKRHVEGVETYTGPAGGWGALKAVARALSNEMSVSVPREMKGLLTLNQPTGFDCPGCAWPDPRHTSSFEFCENGAKAVAWEATSKRTTPEFFATHTVSELWTWSDLALEGEGRLTHPLAYDAATDTYRPIAWEDAFRRIGEALRALPDPNMAEFYTSGRTSNEAAFLYQLFVREYGTNNFPDCSNMCHEATSVGLPESIGVGKGTVTLEDFDHADAIFCIGHNPGTNHPRMLGTLREASRRGCKIVVFNPLRERGLERFQNPQNPFEMATLGSTPIASSYYQVAIGGDMAVLKGMMKHLIALDRAQTAADNPGVLDRAFIAENTNGFDALVADIDTLDWSQIERYAGLSRADIEAAAQAYAEAERVIVCYGMGVTQHRHGTSNVHQIANLLLMRGNIGREGAGICPLRGHSNVQGDRTVGITEIPSDELLDNLERAFPIKAPRHKGHNAVEAIEAISKGHAKALISLGGNLAVAMPDPDVTFPAMRQLDLAVHIATKLNRSHLLLAKQSFILPCLGRTELDIQETGRQSVTVEDSMSMVHASSGGLKPASEHLKSEPAIVAELALATLPNTRVPWRELVADYSRIRDKIEAVFPDFHDFNQRVARRGGFRLTVPASKRVWKTRSGKAEFIVAPGLEEDPRCNQSGALILATVRSHDQYNTTIYTLDDRYRGITGRRDILFMNVGDLAARGLRHGDVVDVETVCNEGDASRTLSGLTVVAFDIAAGSVAAYYPEANNLIAIDQYDRRSGTPSYKSVPVSVRRAARPI